VNDAFVFSIEYEASPLKGVPPEALAFVRSRLAAATT
jgi:hypothetical protein